MNHLRMENYFDQQFELRYFEMDESGVASPTSILTLLEETAAEHCYSIDKGLYQLAEQNKGWVLVSGAMEMERYPRYKEKITIRTWLSHYSIIKGTRENIIYDEQNNIIGRAKGLWVFFDIEKRKPVPIPDEIKEKWGLFSEKSIETNISKKIVAVGNSDYASTFKINRYDTDIIKHVNNIRYLQWLIESIPNDVREQYYLYSIDGRFISEAHFGQTIVLLTQIDSHSNEIAFTHSITVVGRDTVCAAAKTIWRRHEPQSHKLT